jgi:hypothetical protein
MLEPDRLGEIDSRQPDSGGPQYLGEEPG